MLVGRGVARSVSMCLNKLLINSKANLATMFHSSLNRPYIYMRSLPYGCLGVHATLDGGWSVCERMTIIRDNLNYQLLVLFPFLEWLYVDYQISIVWSWP